MDDYMFRHYVGECRVVEEATSYIEMLNYSDPTYNTSEEHALTSDEFDNFLRRRGAFEPPKLREGVKLLSGIRLVVQKNAKDKDTFAPRVISLPKEAYGDMDEGDRHLQIIHRKSDVRKKGKTRGWEMLLSHNFTTSLTTGFIKGTPSSDIPAALHHMLQCGSQHSPTTAHGLLLPTIMLSLDLSPAHDQKQRDARDWLRRLENAVSLRDEVEVQERDLLRLHASITARLEFYRVKLTGLENYVHTTLARLKVQREALYNIMSQREARLNLEIAGEQRRIAHASKRDSTAMKTISLMGAVFLPGTYLASVFSTSFFDFKPTSSRVASELWIYFIVTIPLTAAIVGSWWWWDRRREAQFARDDEDLEKNIDKMEKDIMHHLRKRTMSKAHTWNTISAPPRP
ncbi:hypothetical protein CDD80_5639 [Ophiocordyceps camponoti-rufipedis]|uniref:Uncharacterized protein n=1 Tax=Ophiocordyceps camponoti-rufipedis TaxID=2004952 RepID=A0A2C5ZH11_9HYPO|nr:hypothetical protein CDD80_5639 [Ophiocordyceps camponoti-rufipedis]